MAYRSFDGDKEPKRVVSADGLPGPEYFEKIDSEPFSEDKVTAEVQKLQRSLSSLETAKNTDAVNAQADELARLKEEVRAEIEALHDATQDNWDKRREAAQDALSNYAAAIGENAMQQPQS